MLMTFLVFLLFFRLVLLLPLHAKKFLLFDYRLTSVKVIVIHVLITTLSVDVLTMHTNEFGKTTINTAIVLPKLADTTTIKTTTTTRTRATISKSIMLLNSTSSAIFMSDDVTVDTVPLKFSPKRKIKSINNNIENNNAKTAAINVDVNGFRMGMVSERNRNVQTKSLSPTVTAAVVKHQRWIRDLLAMTAKNTTKSTSPTTTTKTTAMKGTKTKTKNGTKNTPTATSLSSEIQNFAFITPRPAMVVSSSAFTNISDSTQLPQPKTLGCQKSKETRILSRPKRFLTFPEGSSFSVAVCITVGIIGNPRFDYMAYGLNWGVAYDLPNASWVINHLHGFSRHPVPATVLRRRTRHALYREVEAVVDNMGYNGRDCVLRALCESKQYFRKNKLSMIGEMLRVIFSLPKQRVFTRELRENSGIQLYDHAYRRTRDIDCSEQYDCSFSLLELAFGKYSTPPPGYYYQ